MLPGGQGVGAVADRLVAEGLHVRVGGLGQGVEGRVPQAQGEVGGGRLEGDGEGVVVDLGQAGQQNKKK